MQMVSVTDIFLIHDIRMDTSSAYKETKQLLSVKWTDISASMHFIHSMYQENCLFTKSSSEQ
jgi:hypothetical protein